MVWRPAAFAAVSAGVAVAEPYAFAALCGDDFREVWGHRSLHFDVGLDTLQFFGLPDLAALLRNGTFQVAGASSSAGEMTAVSGQPTRKEGSLLDFFSGASIAVNAVEGRVPALSAWLRAFGKTFGVTGEINMYLSPAGSQAFSLHNDKQDVLAAQILGEKQWYIWDLEGLTLPDSVHLKPAVAPFHQTVSLLTEEAGTLDDFPPASVDVSLHPGSLVYLPRGSLHVASTARSSLASLHLTIGLLTKSFTVVFLLFYVADDPEVQKTIKGTGWSLHRFRQALMKLADKKLEGESFRHSLPLAWVPRVLQRTSNGSCGASSEPPAAAVELVQREMSQLLKLVLDGSPFPPEGDVEVSAKSLEAAAAVFSRHLDKFDQELSEAAAAAANPGVDYLELPPGLEISAEELDGELLVRFRQCRDASAAPALEARWPLAVLPLVRAAAEAEVRQLPLRALSADADPLPKLIFALALAELPLEPPIRVVAAADLPAEQQARRAHCKEETAEL